MPLRLPLLFAACLSACGGERVTLRLNLGIATDQIEDFATQVATLRVLLESPGKPLLERRLEARPGSAGAPGLPYLTPVAVTVEGLTSAGIVRYFGALPATEVPTSGDLPLTVHVRKRNDFARTLGDDPVARRRHTATRLRDGRVLIAGGEDASTGAALASAELFDPRTARFRPTGTLRAARSEHAAALLDDGRVVIAGGVDGGMFPRTIEIYDPTNERFEEAGSLSFERAGLTATAYRSDGVQRVLVAGGRGPAGARDSVELYTPALGGVGQTATMAVPRAGHAAVAVAGGILLAGGHPTSTAAEVFQSATERFAPTTGSMDASRPRATAAVTAAGRVLIAGSGTAIEEFDATSGRFTAVATLATARDVAVLAPLGPDGMLVTGGPESSAAATAEVLSGTTVAAPEGALDFGRRGHTQTALTDGAVLVAGGAAGAPGEVFLGP